eukprot:Hpha_TRINITY_DN24391_c0_g1::TRINITY_DN24391_c0_g1_i1::g.147948::m.147948
MGVWVQLGAGQLSAMWRALVSKGFEIDHLYAFEPLRNVSEIFSQFPPEVVRRVSLHPYAIDAGNYSILEYIKANAKPEDFVVLKLDIDTPDIETELIEQILANPDMWELIDELFW